MHEVSSQAPVPSSSEPSKENDERAFAEFRRKVRESEMLSSSMVRLLLRVRFSGRLSLVVQNGRVLKSG
ncbi:MAG TPA: hypothetical protein VK657_13545, partial [Terriglobales bacterium]|nr:hypothetical protein [Terriglobales bacterium]